MSDPVKIVPVDEPSYVRVTAPLTHLCPFKVEVDNGTVEIAWLAGDCTFELHDLRRYLNGFASTQISHEDLANEIWNHLAQTEGIGIETVTTRFLTAGMEVECSTSPTRADQR